jgi:hypothetical protein
MREWRKYWFMAVSSAFKAVFSHSIVFLSPRMSLSYLGMSISLRRPDPK